jgi:phosphate transport system permease protein
MRSWPAFVSFILGIIPVLLLASIIAVLIWKAWPTMTRVGFDELFSMEYSYVFGRGYYIFGLLPAIIGTIFITCVALAIALPISLAIAVYASEYAIGFVGRALRAILGTLAGIPPIVYGLTAIIFLRLFLEPSFAPHVNNPVIGGIVLSLLIIPFMAPLIDEAIRNVPNTLKEASLALGAGRWHTMTHTILPNAMYGIIAATALGCLKAVGDLMIVAYACGREPQIPTPWWDVFQNALVPLTTTAGALSGALVTAYPCKGFSCSTAYFTGLLLLVMALIVLGIATLLQHWFKKKYVE